MSDVSNASRIVFPDVDRTKGDVVRYYERIAPRMLVHLVDRPISRCKSSPRCSPRITPTI